MKIPFGINFKVGKGRHSDYTYSEVSAFIEAASREVNTSDGSHKNCRPAQALGLVECSHE